MVMIFGPVVVIVLLSVLVAVHIWRTKYGRMTKPASPPVGMPAVPPMHGPMLLWATALIFRRVTERRPKPEQIEVVTTPDGFTVTDRRSTRRADSVTVPWTAVRRVTVITTETGPFIDSRYFHIVYGMGEVTIPAGADGGRDFVDGLQALPGFDRAAFGAAAQSTQNNSFVVVFGK